ncbi:insulinase family protein [Sphingopyxis sp. BSNA05]|uniref:insulinase family protein n=1 Tax=Sphingopyxis sp. BSNA05 TaxID=1236614 RepID=UPI00349F2778
MKPRSPRLSPRLSLLLLLFALLAIPVTAHAEEAQAEEEVPWLYENSDVPVDKSWTFGVLDNGLRYAVKHNGVPPGQVSIRLRLDVGSLMETEKEQGFAHFMEHLTFRGSTHVPMGRRSVSGRDWAQPSAATAMPRPHRRKPFTSWTFPMPAGPVSMRASKYYRAWYNLRA